MKQYKFQALVALYDGDGGTHATLGREPRRMVVRGRNDESGHSQIYTALISCDDERPFRPDSPRFLATLRLAGDDVADYLNIGGHFDLLVGKSWVTASSPAGFSSDGSRLPRSTTVLLSPG